MTKRNWSREELIVAFNLYCKIPFGKIHIRNPQIISLANSLGRTPSALSWKLANFARLDPTLQKRNISGATHGSKEEIGVWNEFSADWERLAFESEKLLAEITGKEIEETFEDIEKIVEGKERETRVRVRVNQSFFRATVLAAYNNKCCVTSLEVVELLNASHIIPWAIDIANRVNPRNGLCLNAIHDRAFDRGLITITPDYRLKISPKLKPESDNNALKMFLVNYDGAEITLPSRFKPNPDFLKYHNENIFIS
ncbi:MAG: HNH endonuclease [Anaerolineales bacterium]|nr:HNH endonuclease [Anaerolineales bacterium]